MRALDAVHVALLFSAIATPLSAFAQGVVDLEAAKIDSVVSTLRSGQLIRVRTVTGRRVSLHVSAVNIAPRSIEFDGKESPLLPTAIDSLWVASGSHAKEGAVAGAIVVGGIGGLLFGAASCIDGCGDGSSAVTFIGVAIGATLGSLTGAVLGSLGKKWKVHFGRSQVSSL